MPVEIEEITTDGVKEQRNSIDRLVEGCREEARNANIPQDLQFGNHTVDQEPEKVSVYS